MQASQLVGLAFIRHDWTRLSQLAAARGLALTPPEFTVHERAWLLIGAGDRNTAAALVASMPERLAAYRWRHVALLASDAELAAAVADRGRLPDPAGGARRRAGRGGCPSRRRTVGPAGGRTRRADRRSRPRHGSWRTEPTAGGCHRTSAHHGHGPGPCCHRPHRTGPSGARPTPASQHRDRCAVRLPAGRDRAVGHLTIVRRDLTPSGQSPEPMRRRS